MWQEKGLSAVGGRWKCRWIILRDSNENNVNRQSFQELGMVLRSTEPACCCITTLVSISNVT